MIKIIFNVFHCTWLFHWITMLIPTYTDTFTKNVNATHVLFWKEVTMIRNCKVWLTKELLMEHMPQIQTQHLVILKKFKIFCIIISKTNLLIIKIWDLFLINLVGYRLLQKLMFNLLDEITVENFKISTHNFINGYIQVQSNKGYN